MQKENEMRDAIKADAKVVNPPGLQEKSREPDRPTLKELLLSDEARADLLIRCACAVHREIKDLQD